jgi:hypothetical protein
MNYAATNASIAAIVLAYVALPVPGAIDTARGG